MRVSCDTYEAFEVRRGPFFGVFGDSCRRGSRAISAIALASTVLSEKDGKVYTQRHRFTHRLYR